MGDHQELDVAFRAIGAERIRKQKAIAKLDSETIEAIVRQAARGILDKFIIYIKSKSVTR